MLHIGVIGCGKIAQERHLPEYACRADVKISGLYDPNSERAAAVAERYGVKVFSTPEEMYADSAIDAVSICSINAAHAENTLAALNAGKHVLCEKPMATTLEDCERMVEAAKHNDKLLVIDQNQRLADAHIKARELIASGAVGRPISFQTFFGHGGPETWSVDPGSGTWFFDKSRAAMGAMADMGIHKTDLIQYLLNQTIIEVTAQLCTLDKRYADGSFISVDDNAFCFFKLSGGTAGTLTASWTNYGAEDNSTIIRGTEGVLSIYADEKHPLKLVKRSGEIVYYDADGIQTNDNQTKSGIIDMFVDAINDPTKYYISGESVLTAMRAVFGAVKSSDIGAAVRVNC